MTKKQILKIYFCLALILGFSIVHADTDQQQSWYKALYQRAYPLLYSPKSILFGASAMLLGWWVISKMYPKNSGTQSKEGSNTNNENTPIDKTDKIDEIDEIDKIMTNALNNGDYGSAYLHAHKITNYNKDNEFPHDKVTSYLTKALQAPYKQDQWEYRKLYIKTLLEILGDFNTLDKCSLSDACSHQDNLPIVKYLVEKHEAQLNPGKIEHELRPLYICLDKGYYDIAEYLISKTDEKSDCNNFANNLALRTLETAILHTNYAVTIKIIEKNPSLVTNKDYSYHMNIPFLHFLSKAKFNKEQMKTLVDKAMEQGCKLDEKDTEDHVTPLAYAIKAKNHPLISVLLDIDEKNHPSQRQVNTFFRNRYNQSIFFTIPHGFLDDAPETNSYKNSDAYKNLERLYSLSNTTIINCQSTSKKTPLMLFITLPRSYSSAEISLAIKYGADIYHIKDENGDSVIDFFMKQKDKPLTDKDTYKKIYEILSRRHEIYPAHTKEFSAFKTLYDIALNYK